MLPIGFPVFTTCGAPQAECTLAQPSKTQEICAPSEFKPHNPPILWKEAGIWYLYGPHVSMFYSLVSQWAHFFLTILVSIWVKIFGLGMQ